MSHKNKAEKEETESYEERHPFFSFRYTIENGPFSLAADVRDGSEAERYKSLAEFLEKECHLSWEQIERLDRRHGGFEEIPVRELHEDITMQLPEHLRPEKVLSFYFGGHKYRLAGIRRPDCQREFYILGFDWDFKLYDHGS